MSTISSLSNRCRGQVASTPAPFPQTPLPLAGYLQSQLTAVAAKLFVSPEGSTPLHLAALTQIVNVHPTTLPLEKAGPAKRD